MQLHCDRYRLDLSEPILMGILNVTPDSFSDGGQYHLLDTAVVRAQQMVSEGAGMIDVGGQSTRPGADTVSVAEELSRVIPVIESLSQALDVPISVDTSKPEVMLAAINAGASMINDVFALRAPGAIKIVQESQVGVCLMHMQDQPANMQTKPQYFDVVQDIYDFLQSRIEYCRHHGISSDRLVIDPGFGFGKTFEHNTTLFRHLNGFSALGLPILIGVSRKRMLGDITGQDVGQRTLASVVAAVLAAIQGSHIIRVHDVEETKQGLDVLRVLRNGDY